MSAPRRRWLLALLGGPLLLAACASTPPPAATAPAATAPAASAAPSPSASEPPLAEDADWHRFSTANGMASISVPSTWTVEGGTTESEFGSAQWIWVRNSLRHEMALLAIGYGGDRGGACDDWDGDGTGFVPARIHLTEAVDVLGSGLEGSAPAYLYAATVQVAEGEFSFHAGYSVDRPADDRMPCFIYDDVAVPDGYPQVTLGTPPPTIGGGLWAVDSFEAGEAYAATDEFSALVDVLRSLRLEAAP